MKNRASASSADNGKIIQIDNNQLVNSIYLCHELKMKQKLSVTYMMTDLFVKKINKNFSVRLVTKYFCQYVVPNIRLWIF